MEHWDNKAFWNERYDRYPAHGSGPGSRGFAAWYKNDLIKRIATEFRVGSIIDVGFGDLCWLDEAILQGRSYIGFDISNVAVERARARYPSLRFEVHDITNGPIDLSADLVVNFDVLIHQLDRAQFDAALAHTLAAIGKVGLISYFTPPLPDRSFPPEVVVDDPVANAQEIAWNRLFAEIKSPNVPTGATAFHEPIPLAVASVRSDFEASVAGQYRNHTVYLVRRCDHEA